MAISDSRAINFLVGDPWRKLASLGLAILLWQFLDNRVTKTDKVHPQLFTTENTQSAEQSNRLNIFIQESQFTLEGFYHALTDEPIKSVTFHLRGATHLVEDFGENHGFSVDGAFERMPEDSSSFEFELDDVRCSNPRFGDLLIEMEPSSVRVRLERNQEASIVLSRNTVEFKATGKIANFHVVVDLDQAKFTSGDIVFSGRGSSIEALTGFAQPLVVDFDDIESSVSSTSARGVVKLAPSLLTRFGELHQSPGNVIATVPIRAQGIEFSFKNMPVLVDDLALPPSLRGTLSVDKTHAKVDIQAIGRLDSELSGLADEDAIEQWIQDHGVRLLAIFPPDAKDGDTIVTQLIFPGNDFVEGTAYNVRVTDSVTVTQKN